MAAEAELVAVVVEAEQRRRVRLRAWPMPPFKPVRFEDRVVHWPIRELGRQQRAWHWQVFPHGVGMESSGFPLEPLHRLLQPVRGVVAAAVAVEQGDRAVVGAAVPEVERPEGLKLPAQPERLPLRQLLRFWTDSNRHGLQSHWPGVNWISTPPPGPACRRNRSPYTTNSASWKVRKQRMAWAIAPR